MASLLASGGFAIEALPAAAEALEFGLKSYTAMQSDSQQLMQAILGRLKQGVQQEKEALELLQEVTKLMEELSKSITQFALK